MNLSSTAAPTSVATCTGRQSTDRRGAVRPSAAVLPSVRRCRFRSGQAAVQLPSPRHLQRPEVLVSASEKPDGSEEGKPMGGLLGRWERLSRVEGEQYDIEEEPEGGDDEPGWGLFDLAAYNKGWEVPWGGGDLAFGMILWLVSFVAVGLLVVPFVGHALGFGDLRSLSQIDQAELTLINQVIETVVGLLAIYLVAGKYEMPEDVFKLSIKEPLKKPNGWLVWVLWGYVLAPVVIGILSNSIEAVGYDESGRGTADSVAQIIDIQGSTYFSLITVTGVLAPLLEETVFRGFLLTSLTKWMPTPVAVLLSSVAFGLCHLSVKDLPQLVCLGTVLGFSYVRSRNLLTPMIIHGTWNSAVLTVLFALAASGVDLEQVLSGQYQP